MMQPLSSVCEIIMGQAPAGDTYNEDRVGLPLIAGASDFGEVSPKPTRFTSAAAKISRPNDIILCVRATIGDLNWSDDEYCLGRGVAGLRVNGRKADRNYIWRALEHDAARLSSLGRGATFKQISKPDIANFEIKLPPLDEQKRIAAILDQADDLRRKRQRAIDHLNQLGQAIFYEMFAEDAAQEYEIGELLSDGAIILHKDGNHGSEYPRKEEFCETGTPFVSAAAINDFGRIISHQIQYLSEAKARTLTIGWIQEGDVLLSHNASVGKVALYDGSFGSAIIGTSLTCFRVNPEAFTPYFLFLALKSEKFQTQLVSNMSQTTRNQVPITAQRRLRIPRPSLQIQKKLAEKIQFVASQTARLSVAKHDSDKLFSSLQHRAFQGEL